MINTTTPYLSVIIAAYNSHKELHVNLPVLINFLKSKNFTSEIIIVDDGSTDSGATEQLAKEHNCIYLKQIKNQGKGAAIKRGMLAAQGMFRIFTDADIPYETTAIDTFLNYLDFKEFHMVVGDRTLLDSTYYSEIKPIRNWASKIFSFIVGRFVAGGMFDTQCGIKGFRSDIAIDIFSKSLINGFAFDVEIIYIALKRNYDIKRLPVKLRSQDGKSVNILKSSLFMLVDIPRILLNFYNGKYKKIKNG